MRHIIKKIAFFLLNKLPKSSKLIILDDYFPNIYEAYRISEFNHYLKTFPNSEVYTFTPKYSRFISEYRRFFPDLASRVHRFTSLKLFRARLFYIVFLHNAYAYLPIIHREKTPFVVNLYAGGFFGIDNPESDLMLKAVCSSPYLRRMVVSQVNIKKYLLEKKFLPANKITFIYGAVPSYLPFLTKPTNKPQYPKDKPTLDVCFVAHKHTKGGTDKGFSIFIETAKAASSLKSLRFHVLGNFNTSDLTGQKPQNLTFHGKKTFLELDNFFKDMDIILAPTLANALFPGSFDGFPTGACREAAYAGVAVFCTDPLNLNRHFKHKREIVIIKPNVKDCLKYLHYYHRNPNRLYILAKKGQQKSRKIYDFDTQMKKRVKILQQYL